MMLHRTVGELRYGSGAFRPISGYEFLQWSEFLKWRHEQQKRAS